MNPLYLKSIEKIASADFLDFEKFCGKTFLVTGATGLIGRVLIDVLRFLNVQKNLDVKIFALTRNAQRARTKFSDFGEKSGEIEFIEQDARSPLDGNFHVDFFVCGASNSHPKAYASDPEGTIDTNISGLRNILKLAKNSSHSRTIFLSSADIYGNNDRGLESFSENDCGFIDCNTLRACYNEAKRLCECLCQIAHVKNGVDFVSVRLPHIFGATMTDDDSKASAQFLRNALAARNIVLKSAGTQRFSYTYVPDAVSGIFAILQKGVSGEAYNVGGHPICLRDFAQECANFAGTEIAFGESEKTEKLGASPSQHALVNDAKIRALGWRQFFSFRDAIRETLEILKDENSPK